MQVSRARHSEEFLAILAAHQSGVGVIVAGKPAACGHVGVALKLDGLLGMAAGFHFEAALHGHVFQAAENVQLPLACGQRHFKSMRHIPVMSGVSAGHGHLVAAAGAVDRQAGHFIHQWPQINGTGGLVHALAVLGCEAHHRGSGCAGFI